MSCHELYMKKCFSLALKAKGQTSPNPLVGCVIVKDNNIISEGYHLKSGSPHAEADALNKINDKAYGATLYCNLEPCCHTNKKTPPCAQRIIKAKVKEVIIANLDPNPQVAGKGVKILEEAGIKVTTGILKEEGLLLNEVFFHHIINKTPFIHLKWAQTLDGKLATLNGDSKWITNELSRSHVHQERNLYDAILVGANTAINDNPKLTIRLNDTETCKKRIVLTNGKELPNTLNLFNDKFKNNTILSFYQGSLKETLKELYKEGIHSIYVEGGASTINLFLKENLYNRLSVYIAPKILGDGHLPFKQRNSYMHQALELKECNIKHFNNNVLFESKRNICLQD